MSKYFFLFLLLTLSLSAQAQQEVSLPTMHDIPNSIHFNPAYASGYKWTISLPSISNSMSSNGPSFNQLFVDNGNGNYSLHLDQAVAQLKENNLFSNISKIELLGLSYQRKNSFFHFNAGVRTKIALDFPKHLAELAAFGNGPYVGKTLNIGPALDIQAYSEIGVGYAHQFGKLRIGVTAKFLNGLASATTTKNNISLYTDPEYYQLTATTDYEVQSSSILSLDSLGDLNTIEIDSDYTLNNTGTAFDFGIVYQATKNLSFSASAIDLGSILWKEHAHTLKSNGTFTYEGLAANDGLSSIDSSSLTGFVDSIQKVFNFSQNQEEFKTPLSRKFTLGAEYKFGKTTLSALLDATTIVNEIRPAFALGARTQVAEWIALGGVVSYKNQEIDHLGLNATFKLGPVQLYLLSDNALSYIFPKSANDLHFRTGLNLVFGNTNKQQESVVPHL